MDATTTLRLRRARLRDRKRIFRWANDAATRAASFHEEEIPRSVHRRWYDASLRGARLLYVVELDLEPVGVMRLDAVPDDDETAEVGIVLAPEHRGRGLAVPALLALNEVAADADLSRLIARIRADNLPSRRVFEKAGYALSGEETVNGIATLRYTLRLPSGPAHT
jgi:RimJ/RimL family protein N-acetyltransferase